MKIKFQSGGVITPPYAIYLPTQLPTTESPTRQTSSSNKNENDKIWEILKGVLGLEGDIEFVSSKLGDIMYNINQRSELGDTSGIAREYTKAILLINQLSNQKETWDKAWETAIANNTLSDYVVDARGMILVLNNEDSFDWITPEEFYLNKENLQPVTNGQLLLYRKHGYGKLSFNTNSIHTVAGGINMEDITKTILDLLTALGKTEESAEGGELMKSLKSYVAAYNKVGSLDRNKIANSKLITSSQLTQAEQALEFILSGLNKQELAMLKMHTNGTTAGALKYVANIINSLLNDKLELELLDEDALNSSANGGLGKTDMKHSFITDVQSGMGGYDSVFNLNDRSNINLSLSITVYLGLQKLDGNYVNKTSVKNALQLSGLMSIIMTEKTEGAYPTQGATFGNQKISESDLEQMLYTGGAIARAELPVDSLGNIRFDLLLLYEELQAALLLANTEQEKRNIVANSKYTQIAKYFTQDGSKRKLMFRPFLLMNVVTGEDLININEKNTFITDIGSDDSANAELKTYLSEANPVYANVYKDRDDLNFWDFGISSFYDHLYKGVVYIPINMNIHAAMTASGLNVDFLETWLEENYQTSLKPYNPVN